MPVNFTQKFPLEAGCDDLQLFYSQDKSLVRNQYSNFGLKPPRMYGNKYIKKHMLHFTPIEKVIYLQTVYKKVNPAADLIKLKFRLRTAEVKLHPRLYSNKIKKSFYVNLCRVLRLKINNNNYDKSFLYISNGSTALIRARDSGCKIAFYSPTRSVQNPYPEYLSISNHENL
jgi:hypothetical protein